jgi:hypothetical protein
VLNTGRLSIIYIVAGLILIVAGVPFKDSCLGFYIAVSSIILIGVGILLYVVNIAGKPSTAKTAVSYITLGFLATLSLPLLPASYRVIMTMLSFALVEVGLLFAAAYVVFKLYSKTRIKQ